MNKQKLEYVRNIVEGQLRILEISGKNTREITLSVPRISAIDKSVVYTTLDDLLGYTPEELAYSEIKINGCQEIMLLSIRLR